MNQKMWFSHENWTETDQLLGGPNCYSITSRTVLSRFFSLSSDSLELCRRNWRFSFVWLRDVPFSVLNTGAKKHITSATEISCKLMQIDNLYPVNNCEKHLYTMLVVEYTCNTINKHYSVHRLTKVLCPTW